MRPPSRRELRKQWLADSGEAEKTPKSIFDLPVVPRRRFFEPAEPPAESSAPEEQSASEQAHVTEHDAEPQPPAVELPQPVRAEKAARAGESAMPPVVPRGEAESAAEPVEHPAAKVARPTLPKPKKAAAPAVSPVTIKPATVPAAGTLLFERIPQPETATLTDASATGPIDLDTADGETDDELTTPDRRPRRRVAAVLGAVAALGMVATMALPSFGPSGEVPASAEEGQVLASQGSSVPLIDIESFESLDELEAAAEAVTLEAGSFVNNPDAPVQYPFSKGVPLTDGFGPRAFPVAGFHDAQDFAAGYGAAVRAVASGKVLESGPTSDGCGFGLKISHRIDGKNVTSRYCHLAAAPVVNVGQNVRVGEFVALVGNSGMSYGPHLHLVIEVDGAAVDPMPFLAKYNKPRNQW